MTVELIQGDSLIEMPALMERGALIDTLFTDPPYPNNGGHFIEGIEAARQILAMPIFNRVLTFWHQLEVPSVPLPLVAKHIWHRSNTNRPDNYEAIYEFANESERASRVFSYPVIAVGLTGCTEAVGHPTQKSVRLLRAILRLRPDIKTVVDPFMGSGSMGVACVI
jgi:DNA modification methylase